MAIGIKITGNGNEIAGSAVYSDDAGIEIFGDFNKVIDTTVYVSDKQLTEIVKALKLPKNTPLPILRDAVNSVSKESPAESLDKSELKKWVMDNGFNLAFWVQTAQSIAQMVM